MKNQQAKAKERELKKRELKALKRKALIFTTDALLALAAITIATTAFAAFETRTQDFGKQVELAQLGRDYLKLETENKITPEKFRELTGLQVSNTETKFANQQLTVQAILYEYPKICECASTPCTLENDYCLKKRDVPKPENLIKKAWVTP